MPPKVAVDALPPPCLAMKTAMVQMGGEVSVETSRRCANGVVQSALNAYRRQLNNCWPDTLYARYFEMNDEGKRQCLLSYLQNPASGGFPQEALSDDGGGPPAKVRRVREAGSAAADAEAPTAALATPMKATPSKATPAKSSSMQTCTPQRSPALLLATSVRSTGTPRIRLSPGPRRRTSVGGKDLGHGACDSRSR